jgi:hypothetical protein
MWKNQGINGRILCWWEFQFSEGKSPSFGFVSAWFLYRTVNFSEYNNAGSVFFSKEYTLF